jgi:DNA-binding NarL/FixJ family response regulator
MIRENSKFAGSKSALIVALPDRLRDSLKVLLTTLPGIRFIDQVDNGASAFRLIMQDRPGLVVIDANLPDNQTWILIKLTKLKQPQSRCIVLVDTLEQQQLATKVGADAALLKGFAVSELLVTIERLLLPHSSHHSSRIPTHEAKAYC